MGNSNVGPALFAASVSGEAGEAERLLEGASAEAAVDACGYKHVASAEAQHTASLFAEAGDAEAVSGSTPLHAGAQRGHLAVVQLLLGYSEAEVSARDVQHRTPLFVAAELGRCACVGALLDALPSSKRRVAACKKADKQGWTPLHAAAAGGDAPAAERAAYAKAAQAKARVRRGSGRRRSSGSTDFDDAAFLTMHVGGTGGGAASEGGGDSSRDFAPILVSGLALDDASGRGAVDAPLAHVHGSSSEAVLPLAAASARHVDSDSAPAVGAGLGDDDPSSDALMRDPHKDNREQVVRLLLRAAPAVAHTTDLGGNTPLALACTRGHADAVRLLLDASHKEMSTHERETGNTPLHEAAFWGHAHVARLLVVAGGAVVCGATDLIGRTPLHLAAEKGEAKVVAVLLRASAAEVAVADARGNTPLHAAVRGAHAHAGGGHARVADLLLRADGGDAAMAARDGEGHTPMALARGECVADGVAHVMAPYEARAEVKPGEL